MSQQNNAIIIADYDASFAGQVAFFVSGSIKWWSLNAPVSEGEPDVDVLTSAHQLSPMPKVRHSHAQQSAHAGQWLTLVDHNTNIYWVRQWIAPV